MDDRGVTTLELCALIARREVVLVEAAGAMYYGAAHLPGAVCLPPDCAVDLAPVLLPDPDERIVVYGSGSRDDTCADSLANVLRVLGYRDVAVYRAGKAGWVEAGLTVDRDP